MCCADVLDRTNNIRERYEHGVVPINEERLLRVSQHEQAEEMLMNMQCLHKLVFVP